MTPEQKAFHGVPTQTIGELTRRCLIPRVGDVTRADREYARMFCGVYLKALTACSDWPGSQTFPEMRNQMTNSIIAPLPVGERSRDEQLMAWLLQDWGCRGHASSQEPYQWRNWARAFPQETRALALECGDAGVSLKAQRVGA